MVRNDTDVTARPVVYLEHPFTSAGTIEAPLPVNQPGDGRPELACRIAYKQI
jgi:hypothetical protein